ncbi:MAG: YeeE/YedE family protein [Chloroflexi bacterium]|nr:YeeE/YedE family protein [Chloroflexota bacterium]
MIPFPLALEPTYGKLIAYIVFLLIGFSFGYVLESSGFNKSTLLAAQFYFKDLRVFKVFFTAIVVAMLLIFSAAAMGLLDYNLIWVNPTYLWSGIVGGLIMGVGFILGGFCPGTSLVALATFKIDGILFVLGGLVGVFIFGETEQQITYFFNGSYFGRLTLMDVFNLPTGIVVVLVTLMALFMLWGGEQLEKKIGGKAPNSEPKARYFGAVILIVVAAVIALAGQPTSEDRWNLIAPVKQPELDARAYQIHPAELLHNFHEHKLNLILLDVRAESDYNIFHIMDSRNLTIEQLPPLISEFHLEPANTLFVVISNDETDSTAAWKYLVAESVPNVYILEGGINDWLDIFATEFEEEFCAGKKDIYEDEELQFQFTAALGASCPAAYPAEDNFEDLEYTPKIKMELKRAPTGGGCG